MLRLAQPRGGGVEDVDLLGLQLVAAEQPRDRLRLRELDEARAAQHRRRVLVDVLDDPLLELAVTQRDGALVDGRRRVGAIFIICLGGEVSARPGEAGAAKKF